MIRKLLAFAALLSFHIPAAHAQVAIDSVRLQPGDMVHIAVWGHPEFSGDFPIDAAGAISHPLLHSLRIVGVPVVDVERELRTFLAQYDTDPAFTFSPLVRVFVIGEVRQPNTLTVPPGTTLAQAIALAGGPTESADLHGVRLIRHAKIVTVDLNRPDNSMAGLAVQSGDQIVVGRASSVLRDDLGPIAALVGALAAILNLSRHK